MSPDWTISQTQNSLPAGFVGMYLVPNFVLTLITYLIARCDSKNPQWKVWKVSDGMTSCYRTHMKKKHGEQWQDICRAMGLKNAAGKPEKNVGKRTFSREMFYHLLMKWVAADDQVLFSGTFKQWHWQDYLDSPSMLSNVLSFANFCYTLVMERSRMPTFHIIRSSHKWYWTSFNMNKVSSKTSSRYAKLPPGHAMRLNLLSTNRVHWGAFRKPRTFGVIQIMTVIWQ